jgi:hypothetical protein
MRAACAPRCANFPKNPISSPKTHKTGIFDNTPRQTPLESSAPHDAPAPTPQLTYSTSFRRQPGFIHPRISPPSPPTTPLLKPPASAKLNPMEIVMNPQPRIKHNQ